jgi:soluble lytic murein transglycosylase-like protein
VGTHVKTFRRAALRLAVLMLAGCSGAWVSAPPHAPVVRGPAAPMLVVQLRALQDALLAWHIPPYSESIRGARLLGDAPLPAGRLLAVTRSIVRANRRLSPLDALTLAAAADRRARVAGIDPEFFCATLLQESAFAPDALSSAGAIGIGQFMLETADAHKIDPFDPSDAIRGSAALLARYVRAYDGVYRDRYAAALAAYNAGPGSVARYHGPPPYPETRGYIADVYDRWARILRDERGWLFQARARAAR